MDSTSYLSGFLLLLNTLMTFIGTKKGMMKKSNNPQNDNFSDQYGFSMVFKADEKYYFQFSDTDGEPLLFSKGYNSEKNCKEGMQAIIHAAREKEQYEINETKKEKHYFTLKSKNQKEICRSRMFDTLDELEERMELLIGIDENIPQYGVMDSAVKSKIETLEEKAKTNKDIETTPRTIKAKDKQASESEDMEKMPRYKFSVIYYPDSKVWMVKNDFSGGSTKMDNFDGQKIEAFIKTQLPADELETPTAPLQPERAPAKKSMALPQKPALQEINLLIRTHQGELIQGFADIGSIAKIELISNLSGDVPPVAFDITVMAKSLKSNQTAIIGLANKQELVHGQLVVPIHGGYSLERGPYRFSVDVTQILDGEQVSVYSGNQLVIMK